jgi:hypothetical protein
LLLSALSIFFKLARWYIYLHHTSLAEEQGNMKPCEQRGPMLRQQKWIFKNLQLLKKNT